MPQYFSLDASHDHKYTLLQGKVFTAAAIGCLFCFRAAATWAMPFCIASQTMKEFRLIG